MKGSPEIFLDTSSNGKKYSSKVEQVLKKIVLTYVCHVINKYFIEGEISKNTANSYCSNKVDHSEVAQTCKTTGSKSYGRQIKWNK